MMTMMMMIYRRYFPTRSLSYFLF